MSNAFIQYTDDNDAKITIPLDRVASLDAKEKGSTLLCLQEGLRVEIDRYTTVELVEVMPATTPRAWLLRARDTSETDTPVVECTRHPIIAWEIRRELGENRRYATRPIALGAGEHEVPLLDGIVTDGEEFIFHPEGEFGPYLGMESQKAFMEFAHERALAERQRRLEAQQDARAAAGK